MVTPITAERPACADELTDAERSLAQAWAQRAVPPGDPDKLLEQIAEIFHVTPAEIRGHSRVRHVVDARSVFAYVLNRRGWTYAQVGIIIQRDASTVNNLVTRLRHDYELGALANELSAA